MLKILILIGMVAICSGWPGKLWDELWGSQLMTRNLLNLTALICKNVRYKMRQADIIQEDYKDMLSYSLGTVTAGVMDKFRHMISIYKFYSNLKNYKSKRYYTENILNGYHVMQGEYNELRIERSMLYDLMLIKRHKDEAEHEHTKEYAKAYGLEASFVQAAKDKQIELPTTDQPQRIQSGRRMDMAATRDAIIKEILKQKDKNFTRKKKPATWSKKMDPKEAELKKKLRYILWSERWKGFNPETEGIDIPEDIAKMGLKNDSDFLLAKLTGFD